MNKVGLCIGPLRDNLIDQFIRKNKIRNQIKRHKKTRRPRADKQILSNRIPIETNHERRNLFYSFFIPLLLFFIDTSSFPDSNRCIRRYYFIIRNKNSIPHGAFLVNVFSSTDYMAAIP